MAIHYEGNYGMVSISFRRTMKVKSSSKKKFESRDTSSVSSVSMIIVVLDFGVLTFIDYLLLVIRL